MASLPTSSIFDGQGLLVLNRPSSLTECVPSNITWTGGTPPYSLQVSLGASSQTIRQFDGIFDTYFVWNTDVAAGTLVSIQLVDEQTVVQSTPNPITVGAGPDSACVHGVDTLLSTSLPTPSTTSNLGLPTFPHTLTSLSTSLLSASPMLRSSAESTPFWTLSPTSSPTPSLWYANQHTAHKVSPNETSTALLAVGLATLLLLSIWLWWHRHQASVGKTRKDDNDTEKQEAGGGGKFEAASLWSDDESTDTLDDQAISALGMLEETRNSRSLDQSSTPTATLESVPENQTRTDYQTAAPQPSTLRSLKTRLPRVIRRQRSLSSRSDTPTVSDAGAVRLSSSTNSTLPPSYRTRRSTVYAPSPTPPPFPPPAYTPPNLAPPPSAFRMPRRTRGPTGLKTPPDLLQLQDSASISLGVVSPRGDRILGESVGQGMEVQLGGPPSTDGKAGSSMFGDAADTISEIGATTRSD